MVMLCSCGVPSFPFAWPRRIQVRGGFQQIRKSLDNIDKRAGIYGNFLYKPIPLLLFRRVAGEG
jgi:hypothetical protein